MKISNHLTKRNFKLKRKELSKHRVCKNMKKNLTINLEDSSFSTNSALQLLLGWKPGKLEGSQAIGSELKNCQRNIAYVYI